MKPIFVILCITHIIQSAFFHIVTIFCSIHLIDFLILKYSTTNQKINHLTRKYSSRTQ